MQFEFYGRLMAWLNKRPVNFKKLQKLLRHSKRYCSFLFEGKEYVGFTYSNSLTDRIEIIERHGHNTEKAGAGHCYLTEEHVVGITDLVLYCPEDECLPKYVPAFIRAVKTYREHINNQLTEHLGKMHNLPRGWGYPVYIAGNQMWYAGASFDLNTDYVRLGRNNKNPACQHGIDGFGITSIPRWLADEIGGTWDFTAFNKHPVQYIQPDPPKYPYVTFHKTKTGAMLTRSEKTPNLELSGLMIDIPENWNVRVDLDQLPDLKELLDHNVEQLVSIDMTTPLEQSINWFCNMHNHQFVHLNVEQIELVFQGKIQILADYIRTVNPKSRINIYVNARRSGWLLGCVSQFRDAYNGVAHV